MLGDDLVVALRRSLQLANERGHEVATLEHLLLALLDNAAANRALASYEVDVDRLRKELSDFLDRQPPSPAPTEREPDASPNAAFHRVLQKAAAWADQFGADELSGSEIMFSILHEGGSFAPRLLAKQGFGRGIQFGRPSR